jgi:hypothetical protein
VTAHRRGHLLRATVVGALVSGAVLLPAAPALAAVIVQPQGTIELNPGDTRDIVITLTGQDNNNAEIEVKLPGEVNGEVALKVQSDQCNGDGTGTVSCTAFNGAQLRVSVVAKNPSGLEPDSTRNGQISVKVNDENENVGLRLNGPDEAPAVTEVTGKVVDESTGEAVANAQVTLKDSAGTEHDATSNNQGNYKITSSNSKRIAAGKFTVTATREGFADATANGTGVAGRAATANLRMKPTTASTPPSAPVASEAVPTEEASPGASDVATPQKTSEDSGPSTLSWILIGMGVLLVLLGIGAIVLLMMRRKDDSDDVDGDYGEPAPNQMAPVGAAAGGYRGGADPTMVGGRPGMNDATAIVGGQQLDEFPDPYAAPPTRVGYAGAGGYGDGAATSVAPGPGYGGGTYAGGGDPGYGQPAEPGYGGNGYGSNGYAGAGGANGGYGGGQYGDDARGGYGGGQHGAQHGYDDAPHGGGGYDAPPRGGYDQPTGRFQAGGGAEGYGAVGGANGANGYGPAQAGQAGQGGHGGGGYDGGGAGGYPQAGGYERQPSEYERGAGGPGDQRNGRGRSVDWLD